MAKLTGKSMTAVVTEALRTQLQQVRRSQAKEVRLQELLAISERCAAYIHQPVKAVEQGQMLYDDMGMPG